MTGDGGVANAPPPPSPVDHLLAALEAAPPPPPVALLEALDGAHLGRDTLAARAAQEAATGAGQVPWWDAETGGVRLAGLALQRARLRGTELDGADLSGASLPHLVLTGINLHGVRFAGAWLERTRMLPSQLGGAIGEERAGEWDSAREGYVALEQNFRSLGNADAASWAFRRGRRMRKLAFRAEASRPLQAAGGWPPPVRASIWPSRREKSTGLAW